MELYEAVRSVPDSAKKIIGAGRLKGYTDINPMWRIKTLTEQFGPCGIGWHYVPKSREFVSGSNGEVAVLVEIDLFVRFGEEWSKPIHGTGGSMFVAKETSGLHTDDEAVKKATTDAISVACKALGIGADVYWDSDRTKYSGQKNTTKPNVTSEHTPRELLIIELHKRGINVDDYAREHGLTTKTTKEEFEQLLEALK